MWRNTIKVQGEEVVQMSVAAFEESRFSVIVPAHNAADTLADCLRAIFTSSAHLDEVIVFNDGSTDDTLRIAQGFPVQVLSNTGLPLGPGLGRNRCAAIAKSKILVFVDADVIVHRGAIETLVSTIVENLTVAAAFGSYDDRPRSRRIAALYASLRHHYVHQNGQTNALTFWAGLGAIRQSAFQDVGQFDSRIGRSSIEDIELGVRLKAAGYQIRLVPTAQGTHCKDWRLLELWRTDIFRRAIPWSRLLVSGATRSMSLNLSRAERLRVILAYNTLLAGGVGIVTELNWVGPAGIFIYAMSIASFLALLFRVGGTRALVGGLALHFCYYIYSSVSFAAIAAHNVLGSLTRRLTDRKAGTATKRIEI
jgi:glycosyltransferase involved in cell wall biosynthesis